MSRLYIRVMTGFYTHRKTVRLRIKLGSDALWIPPRLWAYAAENQPDGNLAGYSSAELAELVGCPKYASSMLQALQDSGFIDKSGMIHDWAEHNGYHDTFSKRAKLAANARWEKEREKEKGKRKQESGDKHCLTDATSIPQASPEKPPITAEQIYQAYPLKVGKPAALRAITKAIQKTSPEVLLELTKTYAARRNGDLSFTPHPSTWFNQERFNDDPATWVRHETNGKLNIQPDYEKGF